MTNEEQQQGWRLVAIGLLGLVLLIGGFGAVIAFTPVPRSNWRPDVTYRQKPTDSAEKSVSDKINDRRPAAETGGAEKASDDPAAGGLRRARATIE